MTIITVRSVNTHKGHLSELMLELGENSLDPTRWEVMENHNRRNEADGDVLSMYVLRQSSLSVA